MVPHDMYHNEKSYIHTVEEVQSESGLLGLFTITDKVKDKGEEDRRCRCYERQLVIGLVALRGPMYLRVCVNEDTPVFMCE